MVRYPGAILSDFSSDGERVCGCDSGEFPRARERGAYRKKTGVIKVTKKEITASLMKQLELQNKTSDFYVDLVNDYVEYWDLKKKMVRDIRKNGIRYKTINGNGIEVEKPNESVTNLPKITTAMLKILSDLNLKEPLSESSDEDDYL